MLILHRDKFGYHCLPPSGCQGEQDVFKRPEGLDQHQIQVHAGLAQKGKYHSGNLAIEPEPPSEGEESNMSNGEYNANGKMTDEEKRKNFVERNR